MGKSTWQTSLAEQLSRNERCKLFITVIDSTEIKWLFFDNLWFDISVKRKGKIYYLAKRCQESPQRAQSVKSDMYGPSLFQWAFSFIQVYGVSNIYQWAKVQQQSQILFQNVSRHWQYGRKKTTLVNNFLLKKCRFVGQTLQFSFIYQYFIYFFT